MKCKLFLNPVVTTGKILILHSSIKISALASASVLISRSSMVSSKTNVQQARLKQENIQLQSNQARQQLRSDVLKSLTDARAARLNMYSAQKLLKPKVAHLRYQKRYESVQPTVFELITSKIISIPLSEDTHHQPIRLYL